MGEAITAGVRAGHTVAVGNEVIWLGGLLASCGIKLRKQAVFSGRPGVSAFSVTRSLELA